MSDFGVGSGVTLQLVYSPLDEQSCDVPSMESSSTPTPGLSLSALRDPVTEIDVENKRVSAQMEQMRREIGLLEMHQQNTQSKTPILRTSSGGIVRARYNRIMEQKASTRERLGVVQTNKDRLLSGLYQPQ